MARKSRCEVQSLARGPDTLTILAEADQPVGVTELAGILKMGNCQRRHVLGWLH